MPVRIDFNQAKTLARIDGVWGKALALLSQEILNDCNQYCKEDTGALIASSLTHSRLDEGVLVWATPYARRQYYEIQTAYTDVNPQATWRWAEVAKNHHLPEWRKKAKRLMEMNL